MPLDQGVYRHSPQIEIRLKYMASKLGEQIVPHLVSAISSAPGDSKITASVCFSGLRSSSQTESPLIEILKLARDFDAERLAIESLGRLGAHGWSYELEQFTKYGVWMSNIVEDREIQAYPFEKLSSYLLQAFGRFAAGVTDRGEADSMFRRLTSFIALRHNRLPNRVPNSYMLIEPLKHEFTERSVDSLISYWGRSSDQNLQILCMVILREIAPLRAAKFLLETAISPTSSASVS